MRRRLLDVNDTLTPADHKSHRRYGFEVTRACQALEIHVRYTPKLLSEAESVGLAEASLRDQEAALAERVGEPVAHRWAANVGPLRAGLRIANMLTISVDDSEGVYRGAAHRQSDDQRLVLAPQAASPGLVAGALPVGAWWLTLSAHTLVSPQCAVSIQIGAEMASSD
jgi:hypothetical protein